MTLFENNMDIQPGLFDTGEKPADVDLTWLRPEMMEYISYDRKSKDVDFWLKDTGVYAPYVAIHDNGDITASSLNVLKGHEDVPQVLRSLNTGSYYPANRPLLGQNIRLPKWMTGKARNMRNEMGGGL